jgi:hypothetical protein
MLLLLARLRCVNVSACGRRQFTGACSYLLVGLRAISNLIVTSTSRRVYCRAKACDLLVSMFQVFQRFDDTVRLLHIGR